MTDRNVLLAVSPEEFDLILASLRLWQRSCPPSEILDIAFNDRGTTLSDSQIDDLCEDMNTGGRKPAIVEAAEGAITLIKEFHQECEEREYTDVGDHWTNTGKVFEALHFGLAGELVLEESWGTNGVMMQTVRLSDGTEIVRKKPVIEGGF